jgi:hypothetical protein
MARSSTSELQPRVFARRPITRPADQKAKEGTTQRANGAGAKARDDQLCQPQITPEHTAANILVTNEFVVNLVSQDNAQAMNITCVEAPADVDELELAGLTPVQSQRVAPPLIAESPVSFECRTLTCL